MVFSPLRVKSPASSRIYLSPVDSLPAEDGTAAAVCEPDALPDEAAVCAGSGVFVPAFWITGHRPMTSAAMTAMTVMVTATPVF